MLQGTQGLSLAELLRFDYGRAGAYVVGMRDARPTVELTALESADAAHDCASSRIRVGRSLVVVVCDSGLNDVSGIARRVAATATESPIEWVVLARHIREAGALLSAARLTPASASMSVILRGVEPVSFLVAARLFEGKHRTHLTSALRELAPLWGVEAAQILQVVLGSGFFIDSVARLADTLQCDRTTLLRRLKRGGVSSPECLVQVARVAVAAILMRRYGESLAQSARAVHYLDPQSLAEVIEVVTHRTYHELRGVPAHTTLGALDDLFSSFEGHIRA